ncbi:acetyl-CoA C-acyltransferase family protein [Rhodovulum sp. FJ3]|uniref:acetyl-CoA C-acyltransferase family protein n=1 Tax=Rhodovulum sp. FJ3 TaxID=3079053 RepID=UPI00293DA698|nr:acetyl-CoA C-acyltransferase family protein [Rhodovulum sp. FJ3]MDV4168715.1 acetyl-CoA C-acyltransferase family protein [Rhodovulum sp. FJ3]
MKDIVLVSAARTAVGDFGGALAGLTPTELGVATAKEAIARAGLTPADIGQAFYGNVIHTEPRDMYVSRTIAIETGMAHNTPALTVNRLCGSGLQAIVSAVQALAMGDTDTAIAGGTESMSRAGYLIPSARWGQKMGDSTAIDMMTAVLTDPFGHGHMGVTAENVAEKYGISRETQDAFAVESHRRAAAAIEAGYFDEQIVPITLKTRKGDVVFKTDEHVRADASVENMVKLRAVFKKDGKVTAGNASGINDGAASVVLMTGDAAAARGVAPMACVVAYGHAGVDPAFMGIGPVPAMQVALEKAGLGVDDLDVIESNEAFAAQACAVSAELNLNAAKVNPNGGAVALGHPIGASGAVITTKLLYELKRTGGRYGAATMCIGGGQGIALIVENLTA